MGLEDFSDNISGNWLVILITSLLMLAIVIVFATLAFFVALRPADKVMVPNIVGKDLNSAILELQAKELNTRLHLRYSDNPDDEGLVLEQTPKPGAIVKAGRKVEIVVSNGTVMSSIENYVGKNVDAVKQELQVLFTSGSKYLIFVEEPHMYKFNDAPAGTILAQSPEHGSELQGRTTMHFVVSKGPEREMIDVPLFKGMALNKLYAIMANTKLVLNFTSELDENIENALIASQDKANGASINAYSTVNLTVKFPKNHDKKMTFGVYAVDLPKYPYPLDLSIDAISPNGERTQLVFCKHPGGEFSMPYAVKKGSILVLTVMGKEVQTTEVTE